MLLERWAATYFSTNKCSIISEGGLNFSVLATKKARPPRIRAAASPIFISSSTQQKFTIANVRWHKKKTAMHPSAIQLFLPKA